MKKNTVFIFLLFATIFGAKAQFQGIQIVQSCEIVKFATAYSKYQDILNPTRTPPSVRFGIDGLWQLRTNWSLHTGLRLAVINQFRPPIYTCRVGVTDEMIRTGELFRYANFELPLGLRYYLKTQNRLRTYVEPFGSINYFGDAQLFFEVGFAGGIEYQLSRKVGVFAQPTYRHAFNDKASWSKQTRDNYGLELGVRFLRK